MPTWRQLHAHIRVQSALGDRIQQLGDTSSALARAALSSSTLSPSESSVTAIPSRFNASHAASASCRLHARHKPLREPPPSS